MARSTNELEKENQQLREKIEELELALDSRVIGHEKTRYAMALFGVATAVVLIIQTTFTALGLPTPFTGAFVWFILVTALVYLIGFVVQIAMLWQKDVAVKGKVSATSAEASAHVKGGK
jgi:hypothetical protein